MLVLEGGANVVPQIACKRDRVLASVAFLVSLLGHEPWNCIVLGPVERLSGCIGCILWCPCWDTNLGIKPFWDLFSVKRSHTQDFKLRFLKEKTLMSCICLCPSSDPFFVLAVILKLREMSLQYSNSHEIPSSCIGCICLACGIPLSWWSLLSPSGTELTTSRTPKYVRVGPKKSHPLLAIYRRNLSR